jgi:adenine-specific DNA-methyltransferase
MYSFGVSPKRDGCKKAWANPDNLWILSIFRDRYSSIANGKYMPTLTKVANPQRTMGKRSVVPLHSGQGIELFKQDAFEFLSDLKPGSASLIIASPPYFMGKEYDRSTSIKEFEEDHVRMLPLLVRALKEGGSICWQVGNHLKNGVLIPLDAVVYGVFSKDPRLTLRNRIIWTFGHGTHASKRFSARHESLLWFTKGDDYYFDLESIRVPQKYPGKRHYKGPNKGQLSGNPGGKNPSDVWDIPNVKSAHIEKTAHPCQFPVALVQRCIKAMTPLNGLVVDPFMGSGSSAVASLIEGRRFSGCDIKDKYVRIARKRVSEAQSGVISHRPLEKPIEPPSQTHAVAKRPDHFASA